MSRPPRGIVVFAHIPPPLHGQSVMVEAALSALREAYPGQVFHVNARWSNRLEDIGGTGWRKLLGIPNYSFQALRLRMTTGADVLYYVPGPVKWSALLRDWVVLTILRAWFGKTIFHWHAIGQGEWAWGGDRRTLSSRPRLERLARALSRWVLARPELSIAVSPTSTQDAHSAGSKKIAVVNNGIDDPLIGDLDEVVRARHAGRSLNRLRVLFLSRGTEEKGLIDALEAIRLLAANSGDLQRIELTIAGGVDDSIKPRVACLAEEIEAANGEAKVAIDFHGFASESEKPQLWRRHDVLLFPSRWESFGLVVAEAMAWGLPVVAAASDGVRGVLGPNHRWLVPVADPAGLARALAAVAALRDGVELAQLAREARAAFLERFHLSRFAPSLVESLESVMRG
jgi:glycosyltransferase involved in cell wall biosynthesis